MGLLSELFVTVRKNALYQLNCPPSLQKGCKHLIKSIKCKYSAPHQLKSLERAKVGAEIKPNQT